MPNTRGIPNEFEKEEEALPDEDKNQSKNEEYDWIGMKENCSTKMSGFVRSLKYFMTMSRKTKY